MNSPIVYRGGKRLIAREVLRRFGKLASFIDPFCGSLAILLSTRDPIAKYELVNDKNALVCNFWRAIVEEPATVARYAVYPKIELDLAVRRKWMEGGKERSLLKLMRSSPEVYDAKIAGWWLWEQNITFQQGSQGGWIRLDGRRGIERYSNPEITLAQCRDRLRHVRVLCRDWTKILENERTLFGRGTPTGILLDPPYLAQTGRKQELYSVDSGEVANATRVWAIAHGDDPRLRIALCGLEGEHQMPETWDKYAWSPGASKSSDKERVWFSPHCSGRFRSLI